MFKSFTMLTFCSLLLVGFNDSWARQKRVAQIPNGSQNNCANCHVNPQGGGDRNLFGAEVQANFLDGNFDVIWNYALARLDSDGDGIPNGVELQDPNALWTLGGAAPGLLDRVRNPGDANSTHEDVLTVQLDGMGPHLGQMFELKLYEQGDDSEKELVRIDSIFAADFAITITGIEKDKNYQVDFYADFNGNGSYDPPPTDHSWRETFSNTSGNYILKFEHNTTFTDISSPTAIQNVTSGNIPANFMVEQNYPNPFNPITNIRFSIPEPAAVTIVVFNTLGQNIRTLSDELMSAGTYQVSWDGKNELGQAMNSGVYFYQIQAGSYRQTKRMLLIK